jgi:hypothetical protein
MRNEIVSHAQSNRFARKEIASREILGEGAPSPRLSVR